MVSSLGAASGAGAAGGGGEFCDELLANISSSTLPGPVPGPAGGCGGAVGGSIPGVGAAGVSGIPGGCVSGAAGTPVVGGDAGADPGVWTGISMGVCRDVSCAYPGNCGSIPVEGLTVEGVLDCTEASGDSAGPGGNAMRVRFWSP